MLEVRRYIRELPEMDFESVEGPSVPVEFAKALDRIQETMGIRYGDIAAVIFGLQLTYIEARYLLAYSNAWALKRKNDAIGDEASLREYEAARDRAAESLVLHRRKSGFEVERFVEEFFGEPENVLRVQLLSLPISSPVVEAPIRLT